MAKEQSAWKWWMMNGGEHHSLLQNLAMKILSQTSLNSSLEHNWSMYKYIHGTTQNCLLIDRADKLVYMYYNEKILQHNEDEKYKEDMLKWMYKCKDIDKCFDIGPSLCASVGKDKNLDNDVEKLHQACDRVHNDSILEQENETAIEITF